MFDHGTIYFHELTGFPYTSGIQFSIQFTRVLRQIKLLERNTALS